jgi:hypothetical protein
MFTKTAESKIIEKQDGKAAASLFDEILANNVGTIATASASPDGSDAKNNYNRFRTIAEKRQNILAIATWAISAYESWGDNRNSDAFERTELVNHHKTFVLKPHLVDHNMEIKSVRGIIADSHWKPLVKTASGVDGDYVQTLIFIDRDAFPKYAKEVEHGLINSFSMGVQVDKAVCSICGNAAATQRDFCEHVPTYKGLRLAGQKCFEYNRGLTFIEQSAVCSPADPESHTLYVLAKTKQAGHAEIEKLKKIAGILNSYSLEDRKRFSLEYGMFERAAAETAMRISRDLKIDLGV